ncbi:MAG: DUF4352 domain-containing protein [Firmicutes bacterium]|nr:DUF4352 domain-containing protein [Bacillota bacterium]
MSKKNNDMKVCPNCGSAISSKAKTCPNCGTKFSVKKPFFLRPWFLILTAVILVIIIVVPKGGSSDGGESSRAESKSAQESGKQNTSRAESSKKEESSIPEIKDAYVVGDELLEGGFRIVYVASGLYQTDNEFMQPAEGNQHIFLKFAFINESKNDKSISSFSFECYADGYVQEAHYFGDEELSASLSSGRQTMGMLFFEVPKDAKEIEVEYESNFFSDKKIRFLYEGEKDSGFQLTPNTTRTEGALNPGDTVSTSNLKITYLSCSEYKSDNMFIQPPEGYHFYQIELEFENIGSSDQVVSALDFNCYADGTACEQSYLADNDLSGTLSAGRKLKGTVTFAIPDGATVAEAEFEENIWTGNHIVFTMR